MKRDRLLSHSFCILGTAFGTILLFGGCSEQPSTTVESVTPSTATIQSETAPTVSPTTEPPITSSSSLPPTSEGNRPPTPSTDEKALDAEGKIPAPAIFDINWEDRSVFREGLIKTEQDVLDRLPGDSVYHLDVQIAEDLIHLQGQQEVLYTNQEDEPLNEIYFRLFPNLLGGATTIESVAVNGRQVEPAFEFADSAMRIPLPSPLQPGEQVVIQIAFTVQVPDSINRNYGIFAFADNVLALAHFYPLIAVFDDEGWNVEFPAEFADIVYADSSFYVVRVTAPTRLTLAASGIEIDREDEGDKQIVTFVGGPIRDFYLAASNAYQVTSRTVGETTINSYAPAELAGGAEMTLDFTENALQSFNTRFGPYPFTEFDLASITTLALGIEYPGIVAISNQIYDSTENTQGVPNQIMLESTVAHEVGHQWFYSVIGNDQIDEPWIDESLTQFATLLYYFDVQGPAGEAGFRGSLEGRWERVDRADIPIGLPVEAYSPKEYGAIVYGRGPLFIEMLAETMGQETFEAFLHDYYQTHQWGIATSDSFKQLAEQHCACDLTPLFQEWVYDETKD